MTDRDVLMAAIRANPEDDTPRLAFADWLDERGDAYFADWAALIRAQVEAARLERFSPRWVELARVQHALFEKRTRDWDNAWGSRLGPHAYRRGFREAVGLEAAEFKARADLLFAGNPIRALALRALADDRGRPRAPKLPESPHLERLETLDLYDNPVEPVRRFLEDAGDRLWKLRALGLGRSGLSGSELRGVLWLPPLGGVSALDLHANPDLGAAGIAILHSSPVFPRLTWLDLSECGPGDAELELLTSPPAAGVRVLNLARPPAGPSPSIGPDGIAALARAPALEYLDLSSHALGDEGAEALAASPLLARLRELKLVNAVIGDAGVIALANSRHAANLHRLDLSQNPVTDAGAEALLASPRLGSLGMLGLSRYGNIPGPTLDRLRERFPVVASDEWDPFVRFLGSAGPIP